MSEKTKQTIVIDGTGHILGRLASHVATKLLEGAEVVVVNAEKMIVTGDKRAVINRYLRRAEMRVHLSHKWRPKHPRTPSRLFKRVVRGMLPKNNRKGKEALSRLKVFIGIPAEYMDSEKVIVKDAHIDGRGIPKKYVHLGEISKALGWKGE
ncbi:MAG: 50S ribosomal protein L13 [Desulfurococcales archaeon]|nr:50S ribosomal protein L13 [Desulfurococcales archaeon]